MHHLPRVALLLLICTIACDTEDPAPLEPIGNFDTENDLFLAQFDSKTDADDIHSIAAVATILRDARFNGVRFHAVAGAYGTQSGLYIPANELFEAAFGSNWSDAHTDFDQAVREVSDLVTSRLERGGDVWIAEAGQSDFSAAVIREVRNRLPDVNTQERINVVQHSEWNENNTHPDNLNYVRQYATYYKIPDGNAVGNGTPGFTTNDTVDWRSYIGDSELVDIWELAIQIANTFNGTQSRYNNQFIANGGMDFSDVSETCWIFGYADLVNTQSFFEEFGSASN